MRIAGLASVICINSIHISSDIFFVKSIISSFELSLVDNINK